MCRVVVLQVKHVQSNLTDLQMYLGHSPSLPHKQTEQAVSGTGSSHSLG